MFQCLLSLHKLGSRGDPAKKRESKCVHEEEEEPREKTVSEEKQRNFKQAGTNTAGRAKRMRIEN